MKHIHGGEQQEHGEPRTSQDSHEARQPSSGTTSSVPCPLQRHCRASNTDETLPTKGADPENTNNDGEPPRGRGRSKLSPTLQIPKNRSTGNLAAVSESITPEPSTSRVRFSFDAGSGVDFDSITRCEATHFLSRARCEASVDQPSMLPITPYCMSHAIILSLQVSLLTLTQCFGRCIANANMSV